MKEFQKPTIAENALLCLASCLLNAVATGRDA